MVQQTRRAMRAEYPQYYALQGKVLRWLKEWQKEYEEPRAQRVRLMVPTGTLRRLAREGRHFGVGPDEMATLLLLNELRVKQRGKGLSLGSLTAAERRGANKMRRWEAGIRRLIKEGRAAA